ncbi:MAG TPA: hypothetical protein VML55_20500, partial [Planctomycetaceae bacterium]|nr:hypothetical protein [Planctomycetaceae bacterium]
MIVIGDQQWLWPAVLMAAAALGVLAWSYRWTAGRRGVRVACAALKAAAFVLLAVFLFEPLWSGVRARPGANLFLLVADNSRSLEIRDAGEAHSRGEALKALLSDRGVDWPARLEQDFDVRRYRFDRGLAQCDEFEELDFTGNASSIHGTLAAIAERFRGRPVAGVLLFTDGNATDAGRSFDGLALPPIHPVPVGSTASRPDLAIAHVAVSQTAFEDAPVTIQAAVSASGLAGRSVAARLLDEDGKPVAESTQTIAAGVDRESLAFRFQLRPPGDGVSFYTLDVESVSDSLHESSRPLAAQGDHNGSPTDESTLKNNRRVVQVDRGAGRKRILYVSGRPNWEFKFLRRAIEDDPGVELAALIRIATREAKFDFRGRAGESSNPLFRGFKQDADAETESYDEPVLVRLNMRDGDELRGGFPKSARELFGFHAVVLDDLEAAFFTPDQLDLLEEFVSERGGGLLMLGGQESFARGGYEHTPVARLLPVYLDAPARRTEFHSVRQNVIDPLRESKRPL